MFDIRKLDAFCKVFELRSFSKAGEALFISQPTVSAHIQSLEHELHVRLFDRMGRTVLPTPAGMVFYGHVKQAFASLEAAEAAVGNLFSEVSGVIAIGSSTVPAYRVLPTVLTSFLRDHPKAQPNLIIGSSSSIVRKVQEGELMAGIVGIEGSTDPSLTFSPLIDDDIIIIAAPSMQGIPQRLPLPGKGRPLPPAEIGFDVASKLPWIMREESSTTRRSFESALRLTGNNPRALAKRLEVDSSHAVLQYVTAGLGVSVASRLDAHEALATGKLQVLRLAGVQATRQFFCVTNNRRELFPAARMFIDFLHSSTKHLRLGRHHDDKR